MLFPIASCGAAALLLSAALGLETPDSELWAPGGPISSDLSTRKSEITDFTVQQIRNEHYRKKSGLLAMLDAYTKYSAPLTPALKTAMKIQGLPSRRKSSSLPVILP